MKILLIPRDEVIFISASFELPLFSLKKLKSIYQIYKEDCAFKKIKAQSENR